MKIMALIGAKSTSQRLPNKNIKLLAGHPLMAYTIRAAIDSEIFDRIIVSTDSSEYREIAKQYGAEGWKRHKDTVDPLSTDFEWILPIMDYFKKFQTLPDCFAILRPTSPFRTAKTIKRAWQNFQNAEDIDSLRSVAYCKQHPHKMWKLMRDNMLDPLLKDSPFAFNEQYQALPKVFCQTGSLEIAWSRNIYDTNSVSGTKIKAFFVDDYEGFDINIPLDWILAEELASRRLAELPKI